MPSDPTPNLRGLDPGELIARALQTVRPTSGASFWTPPDAEELARLLPQYRIESLLGHGGMGAVYKGRQEALDRPVAIKLLPAEIAGDADFVARFRREARTLAQLQHPGIVGVYDFGQTDAGHLFFVMEFIDGTDLQQVLRRPQLNPEQALEATCQICEALQYAHSRGVIHRDIKPANILLTRDGRVKLADFGLAHPAGEHGGGLTHTNLVMGTPDYMAPEQREGRADQRADIYALGVTLYEMLTGQRPHGVFAPPSQRATVDARIDDVVLRALQQEPARRYQQVSEMKTDVDRIRSTPPHGIALAPASAVAGNGHAAPATATFTRPPALLAAGMAALIVALLAVIAALIFWKMEPAPGQHASVAVQPIAERPAATLSPAPPTPATPVPKPLAASSPTPQPPPPAKPAIKPLPASTLALLTTPQPSPPASRATPAVIASTPRPVPATPAPASALLPNFSRQIPNITAWILAPLDQSVPSDVRQNLTFLREDIADEAKRKPAAAHPAYNAAYQLCNTLIAALDERTQTQARAGFRAVEANARTGVSSQALEARRNYMMSWPQFSREESQRAELKSQARNNVRVIAEKPKLDWSQRTAQLSRTLDAHYAAFRAALRQVQP